MEYKTIAGNYYTITSKSGCSVTDSTGTLSMTVDAGGQLTVQAPSDKLVYDDEQAIIFKANFKSPLLALRMLGQGENALPPGYTRVEFLESTGTQYIDTGIPLNSESDVSSRASATHESGGYIFGSMDVVERRRLLALGSNNYQLSIFSGYGNKYRYSYDIDTFVPHEYRFNGRTLTVDGEPLETYGEVPYFESTTPCYLFAYNRLAVGPDGRMWGRIWWVKIAGQAHFFPALDPTGEPCMFDLVSKQPFQNAGSGQFIAGMTLSQVRRLRLPAGGGKLTLSLPHEASIDRLAQAALEQARANGWELTLQYAESDVPAGYRKLDFLESTGTQYIDTGVKLSNESEVTCEYMATNGEFARSQALYGSFRVPRFSSYGSYKLQDTQYKFYAYTGQDDVNSFPVSAGQKNTLVHNSKSITFNGQTSNFTDTTVFEQAEKCRLFSGSGMHGCFRVYAFTISAAGETQVDYVPCISPDGTLGMYNKVDGTLHENAGSGAFIAGLATVDDVRNLWLPETGGPLTVSVPADTPDSAVEQLRKNNPTWQIAIQYRTDNEN